jgi:hypothetical protein
MHKISKEQIVAKHMRLVNAIATPIVTHVTANVEVGVLTLWYMGVEAAAGVKGCWSRSKDKAEAVVEGEPAIA